MDNPRKHEIIVYVVIWTGAFMTPLIAHYIDVLRSQSVFDWSLVCKAWLGFVPFFVLFWLYDVFVASLLLQRKRIKEWAVRSVILLSLFTVIQFMMNPGERPPEEGHLPPNVGPHAGNPPPPPRPVNPAGLVQAFMGLMMCGGNIGMKLYFKARRDEAAIVEREKQSLKKELEFLTYQINPHFFMNTLNNINALIDVDPEKAKQMVIELSRMMRYVLGEGYSDAVPLSRELDFMRYYVSLMSIRYTDNVDIQTTVDCEDTSVLVPPLLFATFVENAFKHGVSYRSPSFIHISLRTAGGRLAFTCYNSVPDKPKPKRNGIGLENLRKRLELIYDKDFDLNINNSGGTFSVLLTIPVSHDKMYSNG